MSSSSLETAWGSQRSADSITPDSAPTMSAMMTGVNTNQSVIGFGEATEPNDFNGDGDGDASWTLLEMAKRRGMKVGVVSTAQITHATPAATYALVRRFGRFSATTVREENEIEAVAIDDRLGYVYYADEADGIHKWEADPDHPDAGRELAHFGRTGFRGDREGIAIYALADGTGYIVCTDQLDGNSEYHVYPREGIPG